MFANETQKSFTLLYTSDQSNFDHTSRHQEESWKHAADAQ